jgi:N utilization substance protein B
MANLLDELHERTPRPRPQPARTGLTSTGARKAAPSPTAAARANSRCRRCTSTGGPQRRQLHRPFTRDLAGFHKADAAHYDALLHGCIKPPSWTR